ncbi:MAG TPA: CHASE3 domain-containing protein [Terrimicrobiaceae bacterium]|nr:CHASE3 domain-containing protein [Terrimicrobiaceae bacterium]
MFARPPVSPRRSDGRWPFGLGLAVSVLAVLVLLGWFLDVRVLKSVGEDWVSMKPNTAAGLLLCGLALAGCSVARPTRAAAAWVALASLAAMLIGAVSLSQYLFGWDLGIDQAFFPDEALPMKTSHPGRMAPVSGLCFLLVTTALLVHSAPFSVAIRAPLLRALGGSVAVIAVFALQGYVVDVVWEYRLWNYTGMAFHTAVCFALLGAGICVLAHRLQAAIWALDAWTTAGFGLGIFLMLLLANVSAHFITNLYRASESVAHRQDVLKELQRISGNLASLQSSQRGYLITGDEEALAARDRVSEGLAAALRRVRELVADNPAQRERLDHIAPLVEARIDWEEQTIRIRRAQSFDAARQLVASGRGVALQEGLRKILDEMESAEYALLKSDQTRSESESTTAFLVLPLGAFLSLTLLLLAFFFLNEGASERVTVEKQLRASIRDLRDLYDALDEHAIVAITDPQGHITHVNDKFCAISKYSREELLGQDHRIINSGHHLKDFFRSLWTTIGRGKVWKNEVKNRAKDGTTYWVDTTIVPFLDPEGKPRHYVAIRADITERKRVEEEILSLNAGLELRVKARAAELEDANRELDTFCYSVSHDLRAPLRAIAGFSKVLAETCTDKLDATSRNYLDRIVAATDRMGDLIDDLLKLSRVTRNELVPQRVDLTQMARSIADGLVLASPGRETKIAVSEHLEAEGDPRLLRVMLENLLGNAWKFTSKTPDARIAFDCEIQDGGRKVFSVADNGAGFDMQFAGKLFGPFQRLHAAGDFPGTGIGLATVQRIIHRHGGSVWADAAPGRGATFFFTFEPPKP